jgi:hypothetical protein
MTQETFWLVLSVAAVVVAVALGVMALVALLVARDARRALRSLDTELAPTLRQARATAEALERVAAELPPRLQRLDQLADETETTLAAIRQAAGAAESIVRGPADVVEGARRTAESVGRGILGGADRLRRRMAGDDALDVEDEAVGE